MNKNQKLELTWIGKEKWPELEPRILIEDPEKSYGHTPRSSQDGNKHTPNPLSGGEYKSPLLGGDLGVGNTGRETGVRTNKDGEL
jgi:adenine-specific DNA-methyltransferase